MKKLIPQLQLKKKNQICINKLKIWNEMNDKFKDNVRKLVEEFVEQFHAKTMKHKGTMISFWSSQAKAPPESLGDDAMPIVTIEEHLLMNGK